MRIQEAAELRKEIARATWNLDRKNLSTIFKNDYRTDWAAHHSYFYWRRVDLRQKLANLYALENAVIESGIGL